MRETSQKDYRHLEWGIVAFLTLLITASFSITTVAETLTLEYLFERPEINEVIIGGRLYHQVIMDKASNIGDIGHPALPARGADILLPYDTKVDGIEIIPGEKVLIGSDYLVEPVARPYPLSLGPGPENLPVPDPDIYALDTPIPAKRFVDIGTYGFRGYQILTLRLHPVEYIPLSGELYYYPDLKVIVRTTTAGKACHLLRGLPEDETILTGKVDNPEVAATYAGAAKGGGKSYDLLILTTPALAGSFQPLKDYHDVAGILTEIHTTDDVGSTDPGDVRNYIRDRYLGDGIQYVIIGADDDLIPAQDMYVVSWEGDEARTSEDMPSDLYFACLDGTWNYDGDGHWGEPTDGENGGDVDLVAEVYVGRAPVGNTTEADRFVNKTIQYLDANTPYLQNVLMVGEHLGFGGVSEFAGNSLDELIDGSNPFGIPSDMYSVDKLYDRDWWNNDWPTSEVTTRIDAGVHILNHFGHGSTYSAMKMYYSQIQSYLHNSDMLYFFYSQACNSGGFDASDCWTEYMHIKGDDGAFAMITNARFGWGTQNSTDGPSQRFNRQFWDAVFNPSENKKELGRANHDSKEDLRNRIDQSCMRWCYYELNLFGDPTIAIKESQTVTFDYPNGVPSTVNPDQPTTFEVVVSGAYGGVPVSGSGQFHYSLNGGEVQTVPMTEISTDHYEASLPAVECGDDFMFYVSAEETVMGIFYDPQPESARRVVSATGVITVLGDDFETDQGWTVSGNASEGRWELGVPVGGGDRGDPPTDYDGSGSCYLTGNEDGNSDIEYGTTILTSPTFDASGNDPKIHYARWYCNDAGEKRHYNVMNVYISDDDGENWTLIETVGPVVESSGGWYEHDFWVEDFITPTSQMKLRFEAASELGDDEIVEAGVDDVYIATYECNPYICGDANGDESINLGDAVFLTTYVFHEGPSPDPEEAGDCNCDTNVNLGDGVYLLNFVFHEGPVPCAECPQ